MGRAELEAALRRGCEEKVREIWSGVEAEAERLRSATAELLKHEAQNAEARLAAQIAAERIARQAAAERQAQRHRLQAEAAVAERLQALANSELERLATNDGAQLFRALAEEIPEADWRLVKVNPRDATLAKVHFPQARIETSAEISAGLVVQDREERLRIINTLEKRCSHIWPELLPELLAELRQRAHEHGTVD